MRKQDEIIRDFINSLGTLDKAQKVRAILAFVVNYVDSLGKQIIEQKNKDITDSINYAKRIQFSLLPTERYIERTLNRLKKNE